MRHQDRAHQPRDGDPFCEQHRQYFHTESDVRDSLRDAGFAIIAIDEERTDDPAATSALRAVWTAWLKPT